MKRQTGLTVLAFVLVLSALAITELHAASEKSFGFGPKVGYFEPTNSQDSYQAIYDDAGVLGGLEFYWKHRSGFGLEWSAGYFQKDGESVEPRNGQLVKTGNRRELTIIPLLVTAKFNFLHGRSYSPYVGAGLGLWRLEEEKVEEGSTFETTTSGVHIVTGVELMADRAFSLIGELEYSIVPDAIGSDPDSTSGFFGEDDIGGLSFNVKAHFNF